MGKMDMDTPENGGAFGHRGAIELPPCSFWERRLSEAKTERENREKALSVTFGDSSPRGRAKAGFFLDYLSEPPVLCVL